MESSIKNMVMDTISIIGMFFVHKAVAIFFGDTHIGYIPRQQNETISKLLDLGYDDIFEARIQAVDPTAHPEQQVDIVIYIKRKEK